MAPLQDPLLSLLQRTVISVLPFAPSCCCNVAEVSLIWPLLSTAILLLAFCRHSAPGGHFQPGEGRAKPLLSETLLVFPCFLIHMAVAFCKRCLSPPCVEQGVAEISTSEAPELPFPSQSPCDLQTVPSTPFCQTEPDAAGFVLPLLEVSPSRQGLAAPFGGSGLRLQGCGCRLCRSPAAGCAGTRLAEGLPRQPALRGQTVPLTNKQVFPPQAVQNRHRHHRSEN